MQYNYVKLMFIVKENSLQRCVEVSLESFDLSMDAQSRTRLKTHQLHHHLRIQGEEALPIHLLGGRERGEGEGREREERGERERREREEREKRERRERGERMSGRGGNRITFCIYIYIAEILTYKIFY